MLRVGTSSVQVSPTVHPIEPEEPSMRRRLYLVLVLLGIVAVGIGLDYLKWKRADFSTMSPKSEGSASERWSLTCKMLEGPMAWGSGWRINFSEDYPCLIWAGGILVSVAAGICRPRSPVFANLAVLGVVAWLVAGCARTTLRLT
jgi:hypothetical protein